MKYLASFSVLVLLSACAELPSQSRYDARDVGMNATVLFGTVVSERQVQVTAEDTGIGGIAGGVTGGVAGSLIGAGKGSVLGALGGAILGVFLGNEAEKSLGNHTGIEYIVQLENGTNQSIVQNIAKGETPLQVNERVMIQMHGSYRRILPANIGSASSAPLVSQ